MMPGHSDTLILIWINFHFQQSVLQKSSLVSHKVSGPEVFVQPFQPRKACISQPTKTNQKNRWIFNAWVCHHKEAERHRWMSPAPHCIRSSNMIHDTAQCRMILILEKLKPQASKTCLLCESNAISEISRAYHRNQLFSIFHGCDSIHVICKTQWERTQN